jgi:CDP-diacylglycerol--glycerol-3-phosphate 3-phosphatidyltransferase
MERAERIIALCVGLLFSFLLIPVLWLTLVLTIVTAVQRFAKVWKQAAVAPLTAERIEMRRSRRQTRRVVRTERRRTRISRPGRS